jgi:hypothetical protein
MIAKPGDPTRRRVNEMSSVNGGAYSCGWESAISAAATATG